METITFLVSGYVTWASPDGQEERRERFKVGDSINATTEETAEGLRIIDEDGWDIIMDPYDVTIS